MPQPLLGPCFLVFVLFLKKLKKKIESKEKPDNKGYLVFGVMGLRKNS